jgi:phage shock protein A
MNVHVSIEMIGALFGASIGSSMGQKNALDRARREEMERLGLTQDMLDTAREVGSTLEASNAGLKATQNSLDTQQRLARRLDADQSELYERAKEALTAGKEEEARTLLLRRTDVQDQLKRVLLQCAEEKKRLERMKQNVAAIERRAMEVDALLRRSVSASTIQDSTDLGLSLQTEDPLLQKFKDLGID